MKGRPRARRPAERLGHETGVRALGGRLRVHNFDQLGDATPDLLAIGQAATRCNLLHFDEAPWTHGALMGDLDNCALRTTRCAPSLVGSAEVELSSDSRKTWRFRDLLLRPFLDEIAAPEVSHGPSASPTQECTVNRARAHLGRLELGFAVRARRGLLRHGTTIRSRRP